MKAKFRWGPVLGTVALAAILWFVTFFLTWSIFWFKISLSSALLAALSIYLQRNQMVRLQFSAKSVALGFASAVVLYLIFAAGRSFSTQLFPFARDQIAGIYLKGEGTSLWLIATLLFFVTGPCEEIYWRGYFQRQLMSHFGGRKGWLLCTAVYAAVHLWTFNFMLIGAAAVAGAFWGYMYWRLGNLAPVIISHSLWSALVFAVFPFS